MKLTLLKSPNCQLCRDAKIQVELAIEGFKDVEVEEVDIVEDDKLHETYMIRVPVVMDGETIIQEGVIDFYTIYEYLEARE